MRQSLLPAPLAGRAGLFAAGCLTAGSAFGQLPEAPVHEPSTPPIVFALDGPAPFVDAEWDVPAEDGLRSLVQPVICEELCEDDAAGAGYGSASGRGSAWSDPCGPPTWAIVAPYVWAPAMKGDLGARGAVLPIDLSLADLVELIPDLNGAAMGHLEVGKGRRGLIVDALALRISPTEDGPRGGTIDFETQLTLFELLGSYRVAGTPNGTSHPSPVRFDLLGGARYYQISAGLTDNAILGREIDLSRTRSFEGPLGRTIDISRSRTIDTRRSRTIAVERTETWVDLVVGARGEATITPGLDAFLRADVGGFGIGTSSQLAWNVMTGVDYDLDFCPGSSLVVGYKVLDIDQSKNDGEFVFDVRSQGPLLALAFRF